MPRVINDLFNSFSNIGGVANTKDNRAGINNTFTNGVRGLVQGIRDEANYLGNKVQTGFRDFQEDLARFTLNNTAAQLSTAADIVTNTDLDRVVGIISAFMGPGFVRAVGPKAIQDIAKQGLSVYATQGAKAFQKFITNTTTKLKNSTLVKNAPKTIQKTIDKGVKNVKSSINKSIKSTTEQVKKNVKNFEKSFTDSVKSTSKELQKLAKQLNVSKKDIPNLIKFVKQTNNIFNKAPVNVKRAAQGLGKVGIGAVGLSIFDLWQAFKEGGNELIPAGLRNAGMLTLSTVARRYPIAAIMLGSLGYFGGDKLGRWAQRQLGLTSANPDLQSEYDAGMAYPDLASVIQGQMSGVNNTTLGNSEYPIGLSGRKYHVVGDRIYSFDTGRPVPYAQAVDDINQNINFVNQQYADKIAANKAAMQQVAQAEQSGYQVSPEYKQQLVSQSGDLLRAVQSLANPIDLSDYDDSSDIVSQYQTDAGITKAPEPEFKFATQEELNKLYEGIYNQIAQRTYDQIEQYISPKGLAVDYNQYMLKVAHGQAPYMDINDYVEYKKLNMMPQAESAIRTQADTIFKNYLDREAQMYENYMDALNYGLDVRKQEEVERAGFTGDLIDAFKAEETARHNVQQEKLSSRGYDIEQQRANTAAQTEARQQEMMPYQQASYATEALMNASFSDVPLDTILNSNPALFGRVYPGTQGQSTPRVETTPFQQINLPQVNFNQLRNK